MTNSPELIILDVGHGGCSILRDTDGIMIIDCAPGPTLIEILSFLEIREITTILISHADYDHVAGLITLLSSLEIKIHCIYINADSQKETEIWKDLRYALKDARKRNQLKINVGLTTEQTGKLDIGEVKIEILAPSPELAMSGPGGKDLQGKRLSSNSMSAVIGLTHKFHRVAMLAGDIDEIGLNNLSSDDPDLSSDILVFPHHGGKPGNTDSEKFAHLLCSLTKPKTVFFSFDRNKFDNPREEIIQGIKSAVPNAYITCTQLSKKCAVQLPAIKSDHLSKLPAKGRASNSCCGGTILIKMDGKHTLSTSLFKEHEQFVKRVVPTPVCLKNFLSKH